MKVIILAGGYGTRLYPLTIDNPKPLIKVRDRYLIDYLFDSLNLVQDIEEIFVVTNEKFFQNFLNWHADLEINLKEKITIVNDGTLSNETRLGAIGDIELVIEDKKINDDLLVIAGDNLFSESFAPFVDYAQHINEPVLAVYDVLDLEKVKSLSIVEIDKTRQIISFKEKPSDPKTSLIGIALYFYPEKALPFIEQYIKEGNNKDQPGRLIEWLYQRNPVYTWEVPGKWFDVGTLESLKSAEKYLANKK
jgi:glucose-1-phosphate thymidylyltransferase